MSHRLIYLSFHLLPDFSVLILHSSVSFLLSLSRYIFIIYHQPFCFSSVGGLIRIFFFSIIRSPISVKAHRSVPCSEKAVVPHSSTLAWKIHGEKSLVGYSPWDPEELDSTERLHFHFSLWCIGEGNGSPLQCSCLENPRDGGAWWAAVCGVAQSRTWLKWLSSSSSSSSTLGSFSLFFVNTLTHVPPL